MTTRCSMSELLSKIKMTKKKIDQTVTTGYPGSRTRSYAQIVGEDGKILPLIAIKKKSDTKIDSSMEASDFTDKAQSAYQSTLGLIENLTNLNVIKNDVNDKVTVMIHGKKYSVAQVLSMNNAVTKNYYEQLIRKLKGDYQAACNYSREYNEKVFSQDAINNWMKVYLGPTKADEAERMNAEEYQKALAVYHEQYDIEFVDPIKIEEKINELEEFMDEMFERSSYLLSAINARVIVEYDLDSKDSVFWKIVNLDEVEAIQNTLNYSTGAEDDCTGSLTTF